VEKTSHNTSLISLFRTLLVEFLLQTFFLLDEGIISTPRNMTV